MITALGRDAARRSSTTSSTSPRSRPASSSSSTVDFDPAAVVEDMVGAARRAGAGQGPRAACVRRRRRRAGLGARRPAPAAPGPAEPGRQRDQVHRRAARSSCAARRRGRRPRRAPGEPMLLRFEVRDTGIGIPPEQQAPDLPGLRAGRRLDDAPVRRHRARPGDRPAARAADGRRDRRRQRARPRDRRSGSPSRWRGPHLAAVAAPDLHELTGRRLLIVDDNPTNRTTLCAPGARLGNARRDGSRRRDGARPAARRRRPRRALRAGPGGHEDAANGRHRAGARDQGRPLPRRAPR